MSCVHTLLPPEIATSLRGIVLRVLTSADTGAYRDLVRANSGHLTRHGDHADLVAAPEETTREALAARGAERAYGVRADGALVGQVSLIAVDPPRYGLGYWLAEEATGHGYATAACAALLERADALLGATDVYAGVTRGNAASAAVLRRLGFAHAGEFETHTRFHRSL